MSVRLASKGIADPAKALGQCLIQSKAYAEKHKLGLIRVTGLSYTRREHWAVYADVAEDAKGRYFITEPEWGNVIDLTARQFVTTVPARYEDDCLAWVESASVWLNDSMVYEIYLTHDSQLEPDYVGELRVDDSNNHKGGLYAGLAKGKVETYLI
jgi:hypothetical protein